LEALTEPFQPKISLMTQLFTIFEQIFKSLTAEAQRRRDAEKTWFSLRCFSPRLRASAVKPFVFPDCPA
jgi:hypothetical protein